jgi:hypothetical protein
MPKISELTAVSSRAQADKLAIVNGGSTKSLTLGGAAAFAFGSVKDIRDYGGDPASSSDQTTAIQACMTAAASAGVPAYFPAGLYNYSSAITADCSVIGAGREATRFVNTAAGGAGSVWTCDSKTRVQFVGFGITSQYNGADNGGSEDDAGLIVTSCGEVLVQGLRFEGIYGAGILMRACYDAQVLGNIFTECWHDTIHLTAGVSGGQNNIVVANNIIQDGGDDAIAVVGYSTDTYAIAGVDIVGNIVRSTKWARGISAIGAQRVQIHSNQIYRAKYAGIIAATESGYGTRIVDQIDIRGNTLVECGDSSVGHAAIFVSAESTIALTNVTIAGNRVLRSAGIGIKAAGASGSVITGLQVSGNVVNDTTDVSGKVLTAGTGTHSGMEVVQYCKDVFVRDNDVQSAGGYGIYCGASMTGRLVIKGNSVVEFNKQGATGSIDGIHVAASNTASRIEIDGNTLGDQSRAFDQFIECNNPGVTAWGCNTVSSLALGYSYNSGYSWITVSPSGSPYTYTNSNAFPVTVASSGGTVSIIAVSPDGTNFYTTGKTSGTFPLMPGAKIRVTYTGAPSMGALPMPNL